MWPAQAGFVIVCTTTALDQEIRTMTTTQTNLFDQFAADLADAPAFIERQFPVARISMESYKEREAKQSQTLTGLGKWWGRKPLVLVRATILGLLMPASENPNRDREIFLKVMTMDGEGLRQRKSKSLSASRLVAEIQKMPPSLRRRFLTEDGKALCSKLSRDDKQTMQNLVFDRLPYAEKLEYSERPEQIDGPSPEAWTEINGILSKNRFPFQDGQVGATHIKVRRIHVPRLAET
jgi:putative DNA methylase